MKIERAFPVIFAGCLLWGLAAFKDVRSDNCLSCIAPAAVVENSPKIINVKKTPIDPVYEEDIPMFFITAYFK